MVLMLSGILTPTLQRLRAYLPLDHDPNMEHQAILMVAMGTCMGSSYTYLFVRYMEHSLFLSYSGLHPELFVWCTLMLGLPFAARRLFDETGKEHTLLRDLQRDQLVYVSCGEAWIDPNLTLLLQRKRLRLNNLTCDVALIRSYCAMRNPKDGSDHGFG
eukprot:g43580.t1